MTLVRRSLDEEDGTIRNDVDVAAISVCSEYHGQ